MKSVPQPAIGPQRPNELGRADDLFEDVGGKHRTTKATQIECDKHVMTGTPTIERLGEREQPLFNRRR